MGKGRISDAEVCNGLLQTRCGPSIREHHHACGRLWLTNVEVREWNQRGRGAALTNLSG